MWVNFSKDSIQFLWKTWEQERTTCFWILKFSRQIEQVGSVEMRFFAIFMTLDHSWGVRGGAGFFTRPRFWARVRFLL